MTLQVVAKPVSAPAAVAQRANTPATPQPAASPAARVFAVQAFKPEGQSLVAQPPQRCDSEREARNLAARLFKNFPAVVAWASTPEGTSPEILLKIGRVPGEMSFGALPERAPAIDIVVELAQAAERPEALSRADLPSLMRRAAREIETLRRGARG